MSQKPMHKICPHCKMSFLYNPSVGDIGLKCPYCDKPTTITGNIFEALLKKSK